MSNQITDTIMMVRPAAFRMNEETAVNNYYQQKVEGESFKAIGLLAQEEFDGFVALLRQAGVNVLVIQDDESNNTPDSLFCNNWNSFHEDGRVYLYPMFADNRRREVREDILDELKSNFRVETIHSFRKWEEKALFLEGTGSLILDRVNNQAYAAISERTAQEVLRDFEQETGFEVISFHANQTVNGSRMPIYHTNVMMGLGEQFALICLESIDDAEERKLVIKSIEATGREVIEITEAQCNSFAGNLLQVRNSDGKCFVVMSESGRNSLSQEQLDRLVAHGEILAPALGTIEKYGGGSARCMMAEIFLQPK